MDRAEAVVGKLEVKVKKAVGKQKMGKERRKGWEDVNGGVKEKGKDGAVRGGDENEWGYEEMDVEGDEAVEVTDGVTTIAPISKEPVVCGVGIKEVEEEML